MASINEPINSSVNTRRIRESYNDRIFIFFNTLFLVFILIIVLYPLLYVIGASFSSPSAVLAGRVKLLPVDFTLEGYIRVFEHRGLMRGFANSFFYTIVGSTVNVIMVILAAYPLSRYDLFGRKTLTFLFLFTLLFGGGLIPFYLTVQKLQLLNTRWALIVPVALSVWNMLIAISFFRTTLPPELLEAAQIDGCDDFRYLISVVLPLSGPIIAVIFLFSAVWHWNQYFLALIFLRDSALYPVQLILREILVLNEIDFDMLGDVRSLALQQGLKEQLKFTVIIVASVPLLILYPFVQKYFVTGVTLGSVKG